MWDPRKAFSASQSIDLSNAAAAGHKLSPKRLLLERILASMEGIALGDALGLPVETWTRQAILTQIGQIRGFLPTHTNPFMKERNSLPGTVSDDTELTAALIYSLLVGGKLDLELIAKFHMLALEKSDLGYGTTTVDAIRGWAKGGSYLRDPATLGPHDGFGNGVAMKVAPLAWFAHAKGWSDQELANACVMVAKMTHPTHLGAESGIAHAFAVLYCLEQTPETFRKEAFLRRIEGGISLLDRCDPALKPTPAYDLRTRIAAVRDCLTLSPEEADPLFGYGECCAYHSVPFTFYYFLRNPLSIQSMYEVIEAGGDTDSNASMVGALLGALNGRSVFPPELLSGVQGMNEYRTLVQRFVNSL